MTYQELLNTPITAPTAPSNALAIRYETLAKKIESENIRYCRGKVEPSYPVVEEDTLRPITAAIKRQMNPQTIAKVIIDKATEGEEGFIKLLLDRTEGKVTEKVEVTNTDPGEGKNKIVAAIQEMTKILKEAENIRIVKEINPDGTEV